MSKIVIGAATAGLWFVLSYAAHAEQVCRQVCDQGTCVSRCVEHPDSGVVVHDRGPGVDIHAPGVNIDVGR